MNKFIERWIKHFVFVDKVVLGNICIYMYIKLKACGTYMYMYMYTQRIQLHKCNWRLHNKNQDPMKNILATAANSINNKDLIKRYHFKYQNSSRRKLNIVTLYFLRLKFSKYNAIIKDSDSIFILIARFHKRNMVQFFLLFNYLAYFANQQKIFALQVS